MIDQPINQMVNTELEKAHLELEKKLNADVMYLNGSLVGNLPEICRDSLEVINNKKNELYIILTTIGGSAEIVERLVNIIRHHYKKVYFIIPDYAYSAGTIFCMSGNKIFMDYYSVLGPIDPQVPTRDGSHWVAAMGYLDKVNELIEKSANGTLTDAEFVILKDFDLGELRGYEQARDLTIDLLKKWLAEYKFSDWETHSHSGEPVTQEDKKERAANIADKLSNHQLWKSHGRPISILELQNLGLVIDDFGSDKELQKMVREYSNLAREYMEINSIGGHIRTRRN